MRLPQDTAVYHIYDYDQGGETKLQHLQKILRNAYFVKLLPSRTVLIDSWYVSMGVIKAIEAISKIYYAPLKCNHLVNDSGGVEPHKHVDALTWTEVKLRHGTLVHIKKFAKWRTSGEVVPDSARLRTQGVY